MWLPAVTRTTDQTWRSSTTAVSRGRARHDAPSLAKAGSDWAIITEFSMPSPDRFVRDITTFVRNDDGLWRRDRERHENVLVDTARIPVLLSANGVIARVGSTFGHETLPDGLRAVTGHRAG